MFTTAHSLIYGSLLRYLVKSRLSKAFFVPFFNHTLPDIESGRSRLTAESLLNGENTLHRYIVAKTVAKPKAGIAERA